MNALLSSRFVTLSPDLRPAKPGFSPDWPGEMPDLRQPCFLLGEICV
jgi:hypothetical protein